MQQDNKYKFIAILLGIIAILFAALYFLVPEPTVSDVYSDVGNNLSECSDEIAAWNTEYEGQPDSEEKTAALNDILENCQAGLSESSERLD